jgi:hypothetical protein
VRSASIRPKTNGAFDGVHNPTGHCADRRAWMLRRASRHIRPKSGVECRFNVAQLGDDSSGLLQPPGLNSLPELPESSEDYQEHIGPKSGVERTFPSATHRR